MSAGTNQESLAKAILQLNPATARAKRVVALVTIGIPAVGFAVAVYLIATGQATACDYVLFAVFYVIQMFGITIGFHRYVAHKSFKTSRFFEGVLMISGSMALEGPLMATRSGVPPDCSHRPSSAGSSAVAPRPRSPGSSSAGWPGCSSLIRPPGVWGR